MSTIWNIIYYQTAKNNPSPIYEFIKKLDPKAKAKVIRMLDLLEAFGTGIGPERLKKVTGTNLWELRLLGRDNIRIFYITLGSKSFLLLHAFVKKKQKTDKNEIEIALQRLKEYQKGKL